MSKVILQARVLEWIAMPSSRESSQPRIESRSPAFQADSLPAELPGKPHTYCLYRWMMLLPLSSNLPDSFMHG